VRPYLRSLAPVFSAFVLLAALLCLPLEAPLEAQTAANSAAAALQPMSQANRVSAQANFSQQTKLTGHIPAWATADRQTATSVDLSAPMNISLVLRRDPAVETAFEQLLADQQNPSSPLYHQWLTPQQIGTLYGPTQADLDAITSWATGQGLKLVSVQPNRVIVELTGSTAQVASAFRTSFAYFTYNEGAHLSATVEPSIPTALSPVIDSIHGLTQLPLKSYARLNSKQSLSSTGAHPNFYNGAPGQNFIMPNDFAVIYDLASIYSSGNTGAKIGNTTQKIAIIGRSRVAATDISEFESIAALPSVQPTVVIPTTGVDPGTTGSATDGDQGEATLDVDRVISTAYGAEPDLVVSGDVSGTDGVYIAAAYNVNVLKDPIMTISFGSCEQSAGASGVSLWNTLFSSAAGEGISVFVSSGDEGAAGCDDPTKNIPAKQVLSPNSICASSYATCVGGTEFNDTANLTLYWRSNNGTGDESAISYIPEGAWNESGLGTGTEYVVSATGGGVSSFITKPTWQTGTGVPNDGFRDTPDVAFTAADHDGYFGCLAYSGGDCSKSEFEAFSGTSAAAPSMAGIAALLNTKMGSQQGNLNPLLYQLAASSPTAFHDTTVVTSGVTGCTLATPSMCNNSTPAPTTLTGGLPGYEVGTGYDQATGLGSLDVANFLTAAAAAGGAPSPASFSLTPSPATLTFLAGATTGNTSTVALASLSGFSGAVALTCAVSTASGTAAGTCVITPTSVTLASGGTGTSMVTINTTTGTSGTLNVTVTGVSGSITVTSSIAVTVTAPPVPSFTLSAATSSLSLTAGATTGNTDTFMLTSTNGFAGAVALTCAVSNTSGTAAGTCTVAPTSVPLSLGGAGTSVLTVNTTAGTSGALNVTVTGANGAITVTSSIKVTVTAPAAPTFTFSASAPSLSFTSGATTGNSDTLTLTSTNGFVGPVAITCSISTSSAAFQPMCSAAPASVTLTAGGTGTSIISITSTTAQASAKIDPANFAQRWGLGGGAFLAMLLFFPSLRRRKALSSLAVFVVMLAGIASLSGCGGGSGGGSSSTSSTSKSSAGTYTVTVTGNGGTTASTVSTPFTVTIN
jgi:pseudomonalisin